MQATIKSITIKQNREDANLYVVKQTEYNFQSGIGLRNPGRCDLHNTFSFWLKNIQS